MKPAEDWVRDCESDDERVVVAKLKARDREVRASALQNLIAAMKIVARNACDWDWVKRAEAFARLDGGES